MKLTLELFLLTNAFHFWKMPHFSYFLAFFGCFWKKKDFLWSYTAKRCSFVSSICWNALLPPISASIKLIYVIEIDWICWTNAISCINWSTNAGKSSQNWWEWNFQRKKCANLIAWQHWIEASKRKAFAMKIIWWFKL